MLENENIIVVSIFAAETILFLITTGKIHHAFKLLNGSKVNTLLMIVAIGRNYPRSDNELIEDYHNTKLFNTVGFFRNLTMTLSMCHVAIFYTIIIYNKMVSNELNDQMLQFLGEHRFHCHCQFYVSRRRVYAAYETM